MKRSLLTRSGNPSFGRRILTMIGRAAREWIVHRASSKGAALSFYTLFSMAPILVLVLAIGGFFYGQKAVQGEIFTQLRGLIGPRGAEAIQMLLASARNHEQGRTATIVASLWLWIGATSVFAELKGSLDEIWQTPQAGGSGLWNLVFTRLVSFGLVLVLAFLMLVSLVVSAALAIVDRTWGGLPLEALALGLLSSLFGFAVIASLFAVIYKMLPRASLSWRDVWVGALGTAALFMIGKYAIGVYIGNSGVTSTFGAAGSLIAVLLWVYYSAQIFLFGAEFTRQYALCFGSLQDQTEAK